MIATTTAEVGFAHGKPQNPPAQPFDPCTAIIAQFPASGQGYYTYDSANQRYAQGEVVSSLVNFASNWNQSHPNTPIGVGDISLRGGGNIAGHFEHELGLQVDIRPMRNDNVNGPTNFNAATYSFDLTNDLVQGLLALTNVVSVRFNDPNIQGTLRDRNRYDRRGRRLPAVHDNHLHVTFQSSAPCP